MTKTVRVLVVEDEPLIALDLEAELDERGFEVVGPVARSADAMKLVAGEPLSLAILDINLDTGNSFEVARALAEKGVPFIFLSGDAGTLPEEFKGRTVLSKPIDYRKLHTTLQSQLS